MAFPVQVNATSRTIVVPRDYQTLTAAIGNATAGDTIFVTSGTYRESLQINISLSLIGENRDTTIIESTDNSKTVVAVNHDSVTITGFTVRNGLGINSFGIDLLSGTSHCNITGNKISTNTNGIRLISAPNNSITGNIVDSNSAIGIFLYGGSSDTNGSDYNAIQGNEILSNGEGVVLRLACSYNDISRNAISKSSREGILLSWAGNDRFWENNLTDNGVGVRDAGNGNTYFHNNFFSNTQQANATWFDEATGQTAISVGNWTENYWSDYKGKDNNGDGRGDTPYVIDEKNQDVKPLINPFGPSSVLPEFKPATNSTSPPNPSSSLSISILSPRNTSYAAVGNSYTTVPLMFETNVSLSWVGYSLDGGANVTGVNGTSIELHVNSESLTLYANDTSGNWAVPVTVYFTVAWNGGTPPPPQPFPWLPVAAAGVVAAVISVTVVVYLKKRKPPSTGRGQETLTNS